MKCNGDISWVTFPTLFLRSCVFWSSKNAVFLNLARFWFYFTSTSLQHCPPDIIFLWLSERRRQCLRLKSVLLWLLGICHRRCGPWDPKVGTRLPSSSRGPPALGVPCTAGTADSSCGETLVQFQGTRHFLLTSVSTRHAYEAQTYIQVYTHKIIIFFKRN